MTAEEAEIQRAEILDAVAMLGNARPTLTPEESMVELSASAFQEVLSKLGYVLSLAIDPDSGNVCIGVSKGVAGDGDTMGSGLIMAQFDRADVYRLMGGRD